MTRSVLVLGTGSIGLRHLAAVRALGHRAIAVPIRPGRAAELTQQNIEAASSIREAVDLGATAAVIATDTGRHVSDTIEAMASGCDVLVEKPLAPTAVDLDRLSARAAETKRKVFVAYCLRFNESLTTFRSRLPEVGAVHSVRIACQSYLPSWRPDRDYRESYSARADEGGVLRDLSHELDYAHWLFGAPAGEIAAILSTTSRLGIAAEESADLLWRATSGATVSTRLDYISRQARRTMLAQGEHGEIEWDAGAGTVRLAVDGQDEELIRVHHERDAMMQAQLAAFLRACDGSESEILCSLEEGRRVMLTCDAARRGSGETK